jgi:hypothetical protein
MLKKGLHIKECLDSTRISLYPSFAVVLEIAGVNNRVQLMMYERCSHCVLVAGVEEFRTRLAGECLIDSACPSGCSCEGTLVDCSARGLKEIPKDIPMYTTEL